MALEAGCELDIKRPSDAEEQLRRGGQEAGPAGRPPAASADRDHHGPRRSRQNLAAGQDPQEQRRGHRGRRHHAGDPRLARGARRQADHLPRYARPRGVHQDARPRRQRDGHRRHRGGRRRRRHAADRGGHQPRQGGRRLHRRRHQQGGSAQRQRQEDRAAALRPRPDPRHDGRRRAVRLHQRRHRQGHRRTARHALGRGRVARAEGQPEQAGLRHLPGSEAERGGRRLRHAAGPRRHARTAAT